MKYIVYYRVSTKGQGESGLGLEAQQSIIHHFIPEENIAGEYQEVISAKVAPMERPQLAQALKECQEKGYGLAVAKIDRLSRVTEDALAVYSQLGGFLYSADIPMQLGAVMDKFTLTIYMAIADRERELIGLRTKAALHSIVNRFLTAENFDPFKYWAAGKKGQKEIRQSFRKAGKEWPLGKDENLDKSAQDKGYKARKRKSTINAAWVQAGDYAMLLRKETKMVAFKNDKGEITSEKVRNLSLQDIADKLNAKGFKTRGGGQYKPATVQRLLAKFA